MFNPLAEDCQMLKDAEIEAKIQDLGRKYFMTQNSALKQQISVLLDFYRNELSERRQKQLEQVYQKRDKNLDKLVNVK